MSVTLALLCSNFLKWLFVPWFVPSLYLKHSNFLNVPQDFQSYGDFNFNNAKLNVDVPFWYIWLYLDVPSKKYLWQKIMVHPLFVLKIWAFLYCTRFVYTNLYQKCTSLYMCRAITNLLPGGKPLKLYCQIPL